MAPHLHLVTTPEPTGPAMPRRRSTPTALDAADVARLLEQLTGAGPRSRAELAARASALPTGAATRLRLVR